MRTRNSYGLVDIRLSVLKKKREKITRYLQWLDDAAKFLRIAITGID
jgi:hypothetical protein